MEIIAKTEKGFIIEASENEISAILKSVHGEFDREQIKIGTRIPAIDIREQLLN